MTDEQTKALDEAVAKALGVVPMHYIDNIPVSWVDPEDGITVFQGCPIHKDWVALMAAVEVKEREGWLFVREDGEWYAYHASNREINPMPSFRFGETQPEHTALARCIHAVMEAETDD